MIWLAHLYLRYVLANNVTKLSTQSAAHSTSCYSCCSPPCVSCCRTKVYGTSGQRIVFLIEGAALQINECVMLGKCGWAVELRVLNWIVANTWPGGRPVNKVGVNDRPTNSFTSGFPRISPDEWHIKNCIANGFAFCGFFRSVFWGWPSTSATQNVICVKWVRNLVGELS